LRELRITSVITIAIAQKNVCEGFKCNDLIAFSQRGGKFKKSTTRMLPPPPTHTSSLWFLLSLFIPPPLLLLAKTIFGSGALAGVFPCDDG
jgi:hypothetical protein